MGCDDRRTYPLHEEATMSVPNWETMSEAEVAAYYQEHKDDPDLWGEPIAPPVKRGRPSQGLRATITVRFTEEEAELIRRAARTSDASYSEVVRRAVRALGIPSSSTPQHA